MEGRTQFRGHGKRVPMFDRESLRKMKSEVPEFSPEVVAKIEEKSADFAKMYLHDWIQKTERKMEKKGERINDEGDYDFYYEPDELEKVKIILAQYKADLRELEANGHLQDRKQELFYAKQAYRFGKRI